ncbi:polysaccharide biosynthesis tyrosine autokinase [Ferrimonas balearica]|uniref:GumC family protein n=1 Tax=Ferrimonas balearica TaxID=44012 RepID=UPI001C57AC74|nr:polysaccharide biosynthesis tyrosine autokinase [Ferrimonas balearica]MBW3141630.1 polysaccharide biosynthesis tyrosine autokinase [Ferrimonas balearica]
MNRDAGVRQEPGLKMEWVGISGRMAVLARYRWWILLATLVTTIVAALYVTRLPAIYASTATLLLENTPSKVVSIEGVYGVDSSRDEYFQTQYEIIQSRKIAETVIDELRLTEQQEFVPVQSSGFGLAMVKGWVQQQLGRLFGSADAGPPPTAEEQAYRLRQQVIGEYYQRLTLKPVRNTQLVSIQFEAQDPQLAAEVANAIGQAYIESYMEDKLVATQEATGWMRERLEKLKSNLRASEESLQQFREDAGLVDVEGLLTLESQELEKIANRLSEARERRSAAESVARTVSSSGGGDIEQLASLPEINRHPSVQRLRDAESQAEQKVAQLSKRYGPKHKAMITAEAELNEVRVALRRQIRELVSGIQQEYRSARSQEATLSDELAAARQNYQGLSKNESEYRELQREVETNRQLYDTFMTRIKETGVAGDFNEAIARFTDKALPALLPSRPQKGAILALVLVASLLLFSFIALLHARYVDVISRASEVESELSAKLLGIVPEVRSLNDKSTVKTYFDKRQPEFGEAWRSVRTAFTLQHMNSTGLAMAISSALPGEGKTTSAISLALSLQQVKRVLLIDCDLRKPKVGKAFELPSYQPGLTNALCGTHSLEQCMYQDEDSGLTLLSAGTVLSNPLEALSGDSFRRVLQQARAQFDVVLLDTPPVHAVSDALVVARTAGSMLFIVRADHTRARLAQNALERVLENKILLEGVVLNRAGKGAMKAQYGRGYDSYYGHGYEQTSPASAPRESAA